MLLRHIVVTGLVLLMLLIAAGGLSACGQKGDLYLPDDADARQLQPAG